MDVEKRQYLLSLLLHYKMIVYIIVGREYNYGSTQRLSTTHCIIKSTIFFNILLYVPVAQSV